jgi:hypothetical protein
MIGFVNWARLLGFIREIWNEEHLFNLIACSVTTFELIVRVNHVNCIVHKVDCKEKPVSRIIFLPLFNYRNEYKCCIVKLSCPTNCLVNVSLVHFLPLVYKRLDVLWKDSKSIMIVSSVAVKQNQCDEACNNFIG